MLRAKFGNIVNRTSALHLKGAIQNVNRHFIAIVSVVILTIRRIHVSVSAYISLDCVKIQTFLIFRATRLTPYSLDNAVFSYMELK